MIGRLLVAFRSTTGERAGLPHRVVHAVLIPIAHGYARLLRWSTTDAVFLPTVGIGWIGRLEADWRAIRAELEQARVAHALPALVDVIPGERYVADRRWEMLMLRYFGRPIDANRALCPRTAALLDTVPGLITANFSVLTPGARIAPHRGIFAGVLRYHLGLMVPGGITQCGLRVGGETRGWEEGASLLFDDTHEHEAWNHADRDRVVLLLDVKRPLPAPLRWVNDLVVGFLSRVVMQRLAEAEAMIAPRRSGTDHGDADGIGEVDGTAPGRGPTCSSNHSA